MKNKQNNLKVAIIGAGICGLYLAWKLAEKGVKISVFEKKSEVGKKECSGLFSERIFEFIPESQKLVENEINSALVHFSQKTVKLNFSRKFFLMEHSELDKLTASLAKKAGAEIVLNQTVKEIPQGYDKVIGCDGPNSFIRRNLGLAEPSYYLGIQGFVPREDYSHFVETWPQKGGFIWRIPRGKETEYGIMARPDEAKDIFERFLKEKGLELKGIRAGMIPQGLRISLNPSVALCGDAAGLTKPWSGGGVVWGLLAADLLLKSFHNFVEYRNGVKRFFLPRIILLKLATKAVYFLGNNFPYILPKSITIDNDFLI